MPNYLPLRFTINRVGEAASPHYDTRTPLDSPDAVAELWNAAIATQSDFEPAKESLISIIVNAKYRPTGFHLIALGSLNECIAHPREIFRPAIIAAAYAFILVHNHQSGDPTPSEADRRLTRRLQESSELLQIRLVDHIIIGGEKDGKTSRYSFKEGGIL